MMKSKSGFTIVELLIVIVVIAILATISVVAYNGIQQRANNTKTITAVNQVIKTIAAYIAENGTYPYTSSSNFASCIVPTGSTCLAGGTTVSSNATLINNLQTISTLPSPVPDAHPSYNGIIYTYAPGTTFNGTVRPARLQYSLKGESQQCGVANVAEYDVSLGYVSSTTGYTINDGGHTICFVHIMGP